jgi:DNA (cytosine-5)-methyltransferase 1
MNDSSIKSFLSDGQQADKLIHASLFSGIGGFDLAAEWMNWENAFHCEWNEFGQRILKYYWPNAITYGDITKTDFTIWRGRIDILTGGFPCQPYSAAGKREGKEDDRHLWPEMLRAIREIKPQYVVGENVLGLTNWSGGLVFEEVQADLENEGYEVHAIILPACSKNAPHKRERVWFVAYSNERTTRPSRTSGETKSNRGKNNDEQKSGGQPTEQYIRPSDVQRINTNTSCTGFQGGKQSREYEKENSTREAGAHGTATKCNIGEYWENFPTQSPICSGNDGLSRELDGITFPKWRNESIKAYGNAIVPQVAYEIFKAILIADRQKREEKNF